MLGEREDDLHDVFDDDDGDAALLDLAHEVDGEAHFGRGEAGQRLVEQQQLRLGGQRAGDFQAFAAGGAERAGAAVGQGIQAAEDEYIIGDAARGVAVAVAQKGADHDVFRNAHVLERDRDLEAASHAEAGVLFGRGAGDVVALEADGAGGGREVAGDAVEEGALAGAVGADEADDVALRHGQAGAVDGAEGAELHDDVGCLKQHGFSPVT